MPLYLVEREFAEDLRATPKRSAMLAAYEADHDITWLTSFLSADKRKTYCLYEVDDVDLLRKHAADLGLPVDAIVEVSEFPR